ncbi:MAG: sulfatase-like hydrolase/transferase [Treponema sp.]|nr:sulfatase-like hydrolase/transferase [Treponema sp.]
MKKPNIIVFFSDQQRFDTLGCNGQSLDVTPRLDRMANEGVNFKMAYTPQPVCGPARACMQSGLYPTMTGNFRNGRPLPPDCNSLARRLKAAGYTTGYVGKWHLASDLAGYSREQRLAGIDLERKPIPVERRGGYDGFWVASDALEQTSDSSGGYLFDADGNRVEFSGYRTDCVTDYALDFIDSWTNDRPYFLFLSHIEPHHQNNHDRFEGPQGSKEKFANFTPPPDLQPGMGDWETQMPDYLGCCNALDRNLGRVLDKLKQKGLYDDTIVIYTSDHGCHFRTRTHEIASNGTDDYKRTCYENTIHIPLVIRGPGFPAGLDDKRLVSLLDIPKTIAEAAGGDSCGMQGDSLLDFKKEWRKEVYIQISESYMGRAIRTDQYTYCVDAPNMHPWNDSYSDVYRDRRLFDNFRDPSQKNNLIDDPYYAEIKADLRTRLAGCAVQAGEKSFTILSNE